MYSEWPFFRATIDNAELALAKTDLGVASSYIKLLPTKESGIARLINEEFARSKCSVLSITGNDELLDGTPWLKESISVRNWYIDPLNFIQVELLRRLQAQPDGDATATNHDELRHLARLTVNGLAAGMRTTG
jgi:phosphoenolpyruvate carboxylase